MLPVRRPGGVVVPPVDPPDPPAPDLTRFIDAHDMTSLALDVNKTGTYFDQGYINPDGEGGIHRSYGGITRDKQIVYPGTPNQSDVKVDGVVPWQLDYARVEVARAKAGGIDGFLGNIMSAAQTGGNYDRWIAMCKAAAEDGTFRYTPNVDVYAGAAATVTQWADTLAVWYATGAARKIGNKFLLSSYGADNKSVQWWTDLKTALADRGYPVEFIAVFLNAGTGDSLFNAFAPISWGLSVWGPARPGNVASLTARAQKAHGLGCKWMGPIRPQDTRPHNGVYAEAQNTDLWRAMWSSARQAGTAGADCIQIITWDDYFEHTHISPSIGSGYAWTKLAKFYGDWWRTGVQPQVSAPFVVLTHRKHLAATLGTLSGLTPMQNTLDGTAAARNLAEALVFLPTAGTVSLNGATPVAVPAQTTAVVTAPVAIGAPNTVVVTGQAGGTITLTSAHATTSAPSVQDEQYKATVLGG